MSDELGPDEVWQWGVEHHQGIREESSERMARESLDWMMASYEKNSRNKTKPFIVRRRVSAWRRV